MPAYEGTIEHLQNTSRMPRLRPFSSDDSCRCTLREEPDDEEGDDGDGTEDDDDDDDDDGYSE